MFNRRLISLLTLVTAIGCSDRALTTSLGHEASLAKGGPPAPQRVDFTITDAGLSLQSDGKGIYRDGVCGVFGSLSTDVMFLGPDYTRIPKSQQAACAGIAPRAASVTLALRHVSDNPHVDEEVSPSGFNVVNVKFGFGAAAATTVNAGNNGTPICGTLGLRFTSVTFPGSDDVIRDDLGGGLWHMYTRPWPDNKGYCENNGVVAFWHVSFDLNAQVLNN